MWSFELLMHYDLQRIKTKVSPWKALELHLRINSPYPSHHSAIVSCKLPAGATEQYLFFAVTMKALAVAFSNLECLGVMESLGLPNKGWSLQLPELEQTGQSKNQPLQHVVHRVLSPHFNLQSIIQFLWQRFINLHFTRTMAALQWLFLWCCLYLHDAALQDMQHSAIGMSPDASPHRCLALLKVH